VRKHIQLSPNDGSFDDAMQAALRWSMSLISAIGAIDYFDAWLAATQLRVALDQAERLAGLGLMSCESRLFASRRLNDMRSIATPMLALAPTPSRHEIRQMRTSDGHRDRQTREDMKQQWGRSVQQQLNDIFKEDECHDDHISDQVQFSSSLGQRLLDIARRGALPQGA